MSGKLTWNYRIIVDDTREEPWYSIYEVFYLDGKPIDHTVSQSSVYGDSIEDLTQTMARMHDVLNRPILKKSDFPSMDNYRREEWMKVKQFSEHIFDNT